MQHVSTVCELKRVADIRTTVLRILHRAEATNPYEFSMLCAYRT